MHSKHSGGKMFFHTDLRGRGPADIIDIPPHSDVYLIPPNDTFTNRGASLEDGNLPTRALPSNGFRYWILDFIRSHSYEPKSGPRTWKWQKLLDIFSLFKLQVECTCVLWWHFQYTIRFWCNDKDHCNIYNCWNHLQWFVTYLCYWSKYYPNFVH